jgi:Zn-finger nucleic acid-binding protein
MELVESRRYLRCRHCGAYHFPHGIEADGVRIVGVVPGAPACPVCTTPMAHATLDDHHPVHFCAKCRGVLLPRETFAVVTGKRRAWAASPPAEPVPLDRRALERRLACPTCNRPFDTRAHLGPGNVVIDSCAACDVIWLDFGEMRQIVDAPGRDRGSRQMPRIEDDEHAGQRAVPADEEEISPRDPHPLGFLIDLLSDS